MRALEERRWALDALSSLGDGVLIVDERARLVYFNAAADRLVGANKLSSDPQSWSDDYGVLRSDEHGSSQQTRRSTPHRGAKPEWFRNP